MTERDFIYWLRGVLESGKKKSLDEDDTKMIVQHLDLIMKPPITLPSEVVAPPLPKQIEPTTLIC
jgi:hypothetical protein